MEKRRREDSAVFFNLTDDPYNPVFDIALPRDLSPSTAPFSSISSSKFEIKRSYYAPDLPNYLNGTSKDIKVFNKDGEKITQNNDSLKKIELYDPFQSNNEIYSEEFPIKFRKRFGRCGIKYVDRKPNKIVDNEGAIFNQFFDFSSLEEQENEKKDAINVYDSKLDELVRMHDKWKYDSPRNDYGLKFSEEPSRLNQIPNETQVIRFGTMLGGKAYEQLREATFKCRREYVNKMKQHKFNAQKQKQKQQASFQFFQGAIVIDYFFNSSIPVQFEDQYTSNYSFKTFIHTSTKRAYDLTWIIIRIPYFFFLQ